MQDISLKKAALREDGQQTRAKLIEAAGQLIAEYGYAKVTSKSICEKAGVNLAAVNYHFGSRNGLYLAVLQSVHEYLLDVEKLQQLDEEAMSPKEKVSYIMDFFVEYAWPKENWQVQVWARELMNPSPYIYQIVSEKLLPKFQITSKIFAEYTGLSKDDHRLYSAMFTAMAPFVLVFLGSHSTANFPMLLPIKYDQKKLAEHVKDFAFAGLDAVAAAAKKEMSEFPIGGKADLL